MLTKNKVYEMLCDKKWRSETSVGVAYKSQAIESLIYDIFEDFENRKCKYCEYATQRDGNKYKCKKNISAYSDDYNKPEFGCNLFEKRKRTRHA